MMSPKIGRPKSKNPKSIDIKVRIDEETNGKLIKFAEKNNITRTEVIRKGIDLVLNKKNRVSLILESLRYSIRSEAMPL